MGIKFRFHFEVPEGLVSYLDLHTLEPEALAAPAAGGSPTRRAPAPATGPRPGRTGGPQRGLLASTFEAAAMELDWHAWLPSLIIAAPGA